VNIRDLHIGDTVTTSGDTVTTPVGCVEEGEELTVVDINRETNVALCQWPMGDDMVGSCGIPGEELSLVRRRSVDRDTEFSAAVLYVSAALFIGIIVWVYTQEPA